MLSVREAAAAIDAQLLTPAGHSEDIRFTSVSTDSRSIEPGVLFIALKGEHFDGHDFVQVAAAGGAVAALVDSEWAQTHRPPEGLALLAVADVRQGLSALATYWRKRHALPVIAVVGSNGKTTTKDMVAAILRAHHGAAHALATQGNFNNDIGLPLSVLRLRPEHAAAVFEIGMNHPGETTTLAAIACPTIGLITNAQREHQEFLHGVDAVAREHACLIDSLPASGVLVINADDEHAALWRERAGARTVCTFGLGGPAHVHVRSTLAPTASVLEINLAGIVIRTQLAIPGVHNVRNALSAAAAAHAAGCTAEAIARGLAAFKPARGRMQVRAGEGGATLIDDSYNANPDSVRAAIDVLAGSGGRTVLVLGDMGEVGDQGDQFHREIGLYAAQQRIDVLLATGSAARASCLAFGPAARHFEDIGALGAAARSQLGGMTTVLVKGSRFMRMERVVEALAAPGATATAANIEVGI